MKTILITGASHGIGKAIAEKLAACGMRLFLNCRSSKETLYEYAVKLSETYHVPCTPLFYDVSDHKQVHAMFEEICALGESIDILINNAGIADYDLINVITPARWHRLFAVNVDGAFYCIRAALPHMLQQQSGCIINVSSMWGQVGASCEAAYSATKGAILALTKALAQELGPSGIRVNAVAPGVIRTDMCASVDPAVMEDLRQQTPIGRLGTPEDIAQAMLYLADAPFLTGQTLPLNGGFVIT